MKRKIKTSGFTLIELLVVIVIIGILAAIAIIAFQTIRQRADNAAIINQAAQYERSIRAYAAVNGKYPEITLPNSMFSSDMGIKRACLGKGYPLQAEWEGQTYRYCFSEVTACFSEGCNVGSGKTFEDDGLANELQPFLPQNLQYVPPGDIYRQMEFAPGMYFTWYAQGVRYITPYTSGSGGGYRIDYILQGNDQNCGPGDDVTPDDTSVDGYTFCNIGLPLL